MAAEYNCTQYFSQYPEANSDEAKDLFITSLIDTIVKFVELQFRLHNTLNKTVSDHIVHITITYSLL